MEADKAEALAAAIAAKEAAEALKAKLEGVVAPEAEPEAMQLDEEAEDRPAKASKTEGGKGDSLRSDCGVHAGSA